MLKIYLLCLFISGSYVVGQTWISRARVIDHTSYFSQVMQETIYEVERRGFSNLKLADINKTMNLQMYNFLVAGEVSYTNGFVLSIQKIELTNMEQLVVNSSLNGEFFPTATVRGQMHLRDIRLGYDVLAELEVLGAQRYTGDITHTTASFQFNIVKNLNTKDITVNGFMSTLSGGSGLRMVYRPANHVTEVLSRNFLPTDNSGGVSSWASQVFQPIILDIVTNKLSFPSICFSNC